MAKTPPKPRFKMDIRIKPDAASKRAATPKTRPCARKDCEGDGVYNVPRSRDDLSERLWLCLKHAREHNESWDFFRGMGDEDIEKFRVEAMFGHRPTWPLGKRAAKARDGQSTPRYRDPHDIFPDDGEAPTPRRPERHLTRLQIQAFETLHLEQSATLVEIKTRYKELVKRFHPDTNGGDRSRETQLQAVLRAYKTLQAAKLV
jgi:hypothetical protein